MRTVDWDTPQPEGAEGLRERKKRLLRRQLSDTATEMFLERGFAAVSVAQIAQACSVSEKTVFNYFPTKESLILDRWDSTANALRTALADTAAAPVDATVHLLDTELAGMMSWLAAQEDRAQACARLERFGRLLDSTPSLRAHQHHMTDRLVGIAAQTLAQRCGTDARDPEPTIAAIALIGLWRIQSRSLDAHLDGARTPAQIERAVQADVRRAARMLEDGFAACSARTVPEATSGAGRSRRGDPRS